MNKSSSLYDRPHSFGWISILLHWSTAIVIVALWLIGMSIDSLPAGEMEARRSLHVTLGLTVWLLLAGRIAWRFYSIHPHVSGQSDRTHKLARFFHYLIIACLAVMLISGPVMALLFPQGSSAAGLVLFLHSRTAILLAVLIGIHVAGALKHLMFHHDETIARIFVPKTD